MITPWESYKKYLKTQQLAREFEEIQEWKELHSH